LCQHLTVWLSIIQNRPALISGTYKEIVPDKKLVFTWTHSLEEFAKDTLVTVTFVARGNGTEVIIKHTNFTAQATADKHNIGWEACLENLAGLITLDYRISLDTDISPRDAFARINAVADWWTKGFTGQSQKVGDSFTVRFGETFVDFKVAEVVPEAKIVWLVVNSHLHRVKNKGEWTGTKVIWEASHSQEKTQIVMTHVGLVPDCECYEICEAGWNFCVGESLRKLLTENMGMPDGGGRSKAKING
jgi:uncharacterized protein YndB with AHSA1/START domain